MSNNLLIKFKSDKAIDPNTKFAIYGDLEIEERELQKGETYLFPIFRNLRITSFQDGSEEEYTITTKTKKGDVATISDILGYIITCMINVTGEELGFSYICDDIAKITKFYAVDAVENNVPKYKFSWQENQWIIEK